MTDNDPIKVSTALKHLRGSDDNLLSGNRLGPGAVLCSSQSAIHCCIPRS